MSYEEIRALYLKWEERRRIAKKQILEILKTVNPNDVKYLLKEVYEEWRKMR
jgi:hypothetical protein